MTDDIVARLRNKHADDPLAWEVADEIERLRATNVELEVRIKSIKEGFEGCCTACEPVGEINKKLREERDEARRTICYEYYLARDCRIAPELIAEEMGWDCFGERWKMMQDALDRVAQLGEEIENGET